jgi:hypothetical protein
VGLRPDDASSEGEHADASDATRTQAARHITMIHLDRRVPRITPPYCRPTRLRSTVVISQGEPSV